MTEKRLSYGVLVCLLVAAGCGSSPVKKPKDASPDVDGSSGGTGGTQITGGAGGSTGGVGGSTGGAGGSTGGVGGVDAGADAGNDGSTDAQLDAQSDATTDAQTDAQSDAQTDGGDAAICMATCTVGDKRCGAGGLQTCMLVNNCATWGAEVACGANRTCTGTGAAAACTCNAAPAACTQAGNFCSSGTVRSTCEMVNGCLALSATTKTCGAHQTCTGNLPSGDCTCTAVPGCTAAGTFCPTVTSVGTCTADSDGCFAKSGNDTTCMNGQVCVANGATAACACPATVGTTLGTGCQTVGQTICSGDTVLTCTMNATSGCKTWLLTTDCAATTGLACGTRGGAAACECPAVTDGNYYVDPVAGNDTSTAAPFPSGAKSPAACRFKTLSKAAGIAVNTGNKIIGISTTLPATFTESNPLNISAGVTLTTDDAAPTPANYHLSYTGLTGVAVNLANNSSIAGFTIENGTSNPATTAAALGCTVGTVTVKSVSLSGINGAALMAVGLQIGGVPLNTCTGTFDRVTADGFATGVQISTSAGTAPVLTSTTVLNPNVPSAIGVLVEAGTVNSTDLLVQPRAGLTTAGFGLVVRPSSGVTVANFLGNSSSIQNTASDAVWLDDVVGMQDPQATLTNLVVLNPTGADSSGVRVESGLLNILGSSQITGADQYGVESVGGSIVATSLTVAGTQLDGVHVTGGAVTLHKSTIRNNLGNNIFQDGGAVLVDDGSVITAATGAGILFAPTGGTNPNLSLNVGGATGDFVDISVNGSHGISLAGTGGTNTGVNIRRANIHGNSQNGIDVAMTSNGSAINVTDCVVFGNTVNGVVVTSAPSATATNSVVLDAVEVRTHTTNATDAGKGIWLNGNTATSNDITATIQNCKVHDNRDVGVQIDEDMPPAHSTTTRTSLTGNDIFNNNLNGANSQVGGISFATSSTLTLFTGNKIHSNGRDQVLFTAQQNGGANWDLDPGSCTSTVNPRNQIYCYSATGVGLRTTNTLSANPPAYTVDADHVSWSHDPPNNTAGTRDFAAGADTTITRATPCAAVTTCP